MGYVITASILSVIVGAFYLGYVWKSFYEVSRSKREADPAAESVSSDWESESWFSWKALISIVMSSVILFAAGQSAQIWYLVPFIAIGSAVAVIFAFSIDLKHKTD